MESSAPTEDREPQAVESISVVFGDGAAIAVEASGDGPPLVAVHGATGDMRGLRQQPGASS